MKAFVRLALLLVTASAAPAAAQTSKAGPACGELPKTWEGTAYAASGDSLAGVGLKTGIRLWGIRAAEMPSIPGMRARAALEDMLGSGENKVSCRMTGWDGLCRAVAQCTITAAWPTGSVAQPYDIAVRLAEDGWAYGAGLNEPPAWDKDASAKIAHFESIARQARKGLWPHWLGEEAKP
jgi:endonuclease YncB( thermonuclease family)